MRKLSLVFGILLLIFQLKAQDNPHGDDFSFDCLDCHTTAGWTFSAETAKFSHDSTRFKLEGQHVFTDCKACHTTLVFSQAKTNCMDCHTDMHNNTVGPDCARCHSPQSWLVSNITEIHQMSRFPLLGAHNTADCGACHSSASTLEFQPLGIECVDCHRQNYETTTNPNHVQAGLSTDCMECHKIDAFTWSSEGFNHDFFPLTKGHQLNECAACHTSGLSEPISNDCYNCHQRDFTSATNPSHQNSGFSTQCTDCHTTEPDWKPAKFDIHDEFYFPIYSGEHRGEWESCSECHTQPESYAVFSCTNCHAHNQNEMNDEHRGINGYSYSSLACFACHPLGSEEGAFNHNATGFLLKGVHVRTDCLDCHTNGFENTSTLCNSCHTENYNQAVNPNHVSAGISAECETCHTEEGWIPSIFNHTSATGFELSGGHSGKQCADCHSGTTQNASPECVSCHQENYNTAPNHVALNYPSECSLCHSPNTWDDADFDHNTTNFALAGAHLATECSACHTSGYTGTSTLCNSCHTENYNATVNPNHSLLGLSTSCENCHTSDPGWEPALFPNHNDFYVLAGTHAVVANNCFLCHEGSYINTPNSCYGCHSSEYNETIEPNHTIAQFPTDCELCHSEIAWEPSTFNHDAQYFSIYSGNHREEWNSCSDCHTQPANYAVFSCITCHEHNQTDTNNDHSEVSGYVYTATSCYQCHPD